MEKIVRNVRDINGADREALEHVIGQRLRENQQIIVNVVTVDDSGQVPKQPQSNGAQVEPAIPEWWNVYEGLSDREIEELDQAVRQRANLTRVFE